MAGTIATTDTAEFAATLMDIDKGRVHDDAGDLLAQVVAAVAKNGGKGKLTLVIEVEPQDPETFADTGVLLLSGKVDAAIPRPRRAPAIFFLAGTGGKITRQDPARDDPFRDQD